MSARVFTLLSATALLAGFFAIAAPAEEVGRFVLRDVPGGFLRLDSRTGAVSHCAQQDDGKWKCSPLSGDDGQLRATIERLQGENRSLQDKIRRLEARISQLQGKEKRKSVPSEEEFDRALGFLDRLLERFLAFARKLNRKPGEPI